MRDALDLLPHDGRPGVLVLAAMCGGVGPVVLRAWLDALGISADERDAVVAAVGGAETLARRLVVAGRPSEIAAAARGRSVEEVALAGALDAPEPARAGCRSCAT